MFGLTRWTKLNSWKPLIFSGLLAFSLHRSIQNVLKILPIDFYVYDTAALLVREHKSASIYDGADNGVDPQIRYADPSSTFAGTARELNIPKVMLYVYPPLLADLMIPFTTVGADTGAKLWMITMLFVTAASGVMACVLSGFRIASSAGACFVLGAVAWGGQALHDGQVSPLLLFLWTLGVLCNVRGRPAVSGSIFAVATLIKLTPILAVVTFLYWRRWRWLAGYSATTLVIWGMMTVVNGTACLRDYVQHVLPAMSGGIAYDENRSFASCLQLLFQVAHGYPLNRFDNPVFWQATALSRMVVLLIFAAFLILVRRIPLKIRFAEDFVIASLGLLSVALSPVSWKAAYIQGFLVLALLWTRILTGASAAWQFWFLAFASIELNTFRYFGLGRFGLLSANSLFSAAMTGLAPATAVAVVMFGFYLLIRSESSPGLCAGPGVERVPEHVTRVSGTEEPSDVKGQTGK